MAEITASMVKDLRESTGVGMMDAKNALVENKGDMEAAVDWLRKKGLSKAAKKSGRTAAEGLVGIATNGNVGAVAEVNSETDFVARNEDFQNFVGQIARMALQADNAEELAQQDFGGGKTVADALTDKIATIGENMTLRRSARLSVSKGTVTGYIHSALAPGLGKIGVLVALESEGKTDALEAVGNSVVVSDEAGADSRHLHRAALDRDAARASAVEARAAQLDHHLVDVANRTTGIGAEPARRVAAAEHRALEVSDEARAVSASTDVEEAIRSALGDVVLHDAVGRVNVDRLRGARVGGMAAQVVAPEHAVRGGEVDAQLLEAQHFVLFQQVRGAIELDEDVSAVDAVPGHQVAAKRELARRGIGHQRGVLAAPEPQAFEGPVAATIDDHGAKARPALIARTHLDTGDATIALHRERLVEESVIENQFVPGAQPGPRVAERTKRQRERGPRVGPVDPGVGRDVPGGRRLRGGRT